MYFALIAALTAINLQSYLKEFTVFTPLVCCVREFQARGAATLNVPFSMIILTGG